MKLKKNRDQKYVQKKTVKTEKTKQKPSLDNVPGHHTLQEILSQAQIWKETPKHLAANGAFAELASEFSGKQPWLFVACGSSYYLSQLISSIWRKYFGIVCSAMPASEFLFATDETLRQTKAKYVVLLSRSGETTEVLRVAELLKAHEEVLTLGVTCNANGPLEKLCAYTLKLTWADEASVVMTRSFTSILLIFQELGARFSEKEDFSEPMGQIAEPTQIWLEENADKILKFAARQHFADFVFLGHGVHYWLAQEAALKVTEMSSSYAQAYYSLEFRHGPRSIAGPDTLITFFISDAAEEEETTLANELKQLGATILVIVNRKTAELQKASDLLLELASKPETMQPEFARYAMAAIPAQLLGTAVGLHKGLNPDEPKNLTRAVVLGPNGNASSKTKRRNV